MADRYGCFLAESAGKKIKYFGFNYIFKIGFHNFHHIPQGLAVR